MPPGVSAGCRAPCRRPPVPGAARGHRGISPPPSRRDRSNTRDPASSSGSRSSRTPTAEPDRHRRRAQPRAIPGRKTTEPPSDPSRKPGPQGTRGRQAGPRQGNRARPGQASRHKGTGPTASTSPTALGPRGGSGGSSPRKALRAPAKPPRRRRVWATPGGYGGKPPGVAIIGVPTGARNAGSDAPTGDQSIDMNRTRKHPPVCQDPITTRSRDEPEQAQSLARLVIARTRPDGAVTVSPVRF